MKIIFLAFLLVSSSFSQVFNVFDSTSFREALKLSANNNQNDIIILNKGVYKTSELGTFIFNATEQFDLLIKSADGLNSSDVILDGNKKTQILSYINTKESLFKIKNITLKDGNVFSKAGMIFSNQKLVLENCKVKQENNLTNGVSIFSPKQISMVNTSIDY